MTYIDLQTERLNSESIQEFWSNLQTSGFKEVSLDICTETGSVTAIENDWQVKLGLPAMGLRLNITSLAQRWSNLSESNISDHEYESLTQSEAAESMSVLLKSCPAGISVLTSTIDGTYGN